MILSLDLNHQYNRIKADIDKAIKDVIEESAFINGSYVSKFEEEFALYQQAEHCIGVGNGTDALEIAIESLNLPIGSEIIVPANSFIASSEAVTRSGHKVVFCDCDEENYTISISSLISKISNKTKAIIAVHLYGHPCDMDSIIELAKKYDLKIIEDCAQAHGSEYKNKRIGALGDIGTFSFYPGKNLGAYGDGGAIVTNNEALALKCRMIANHGRVAKYDHMFEGRNSRLDGLQAAILSVKLNYLDEWLKRREEIADKYISELNGIGSFILPKRSSFAKQAYHLFVVRVSNRDKWMDIFRENNIQIGIHYPISLPKLEAYKYLKQDSEKFIANEYDSQILSLPISEHLDDEEVNEIISVIKKFS